MSYFMDFDPYLIRERNQQIRDEVNSLYREEHLRKERNSPLSQVSIFVKRGRRLLIGGARLAG
jgi:hypothetical protein